MSIDSNVCACLFCEATLNILQKTFNDIILLNVFLFRGNMKQVDVENAVGMVLCHDMTQIIPGVVKDARFRKGHVITKDDIPVLISMGKKHIFVYEVDENMLHENDAALILRDICISENLQETEVKEGKIMLKSKIKGYLSVDKARLKVANMHNDIVISTLKSGNVEEGETVAGMRVVPLVIEKKKTEEVKNAVGSEPIIRVHPYKIKKFGMVVTGSEVQEGIIEDKFSPVVEGKLKKYNVELVDKIYSGDDKDKIVEGIKTLKEKGAEFICCTGGMSVDPDDMTPSAIIESGAKVVTYGAPFLPGAMMLLAYFEDGTPIIGLPGCVMYAASTVFDVLLPKILAKIKWTREEIIELGYGGLCKQCKTCHFPNCSFGN